VAIEVPPSRVPQGGRSPRTALAVFLVALVSIAGFALLGKASVAPSPWSSQPPALAALSPSPAPSHETAAVTPSPVPRCVAPRIAALGGAIARHPRPLAPTGFETLTPWTGGEGSLVADARAGFWAMGSGRLTRLDASGTMTASWTFADDPIFATWGIVPARDGGVWLWGGPTIAWFDGERVRDVIPAPVQASGIWVVDVAEAADGSLWAAANGESAATDGWAPTPGGRVFHWDGRSWIDACRPTPGSAISDLAIDATGGVWVAPGSPSDVSFFDGTTWSIPPIDPASTTYRAAVDTWTAGLVAADDGSLWIRTVHGGLGHVDGKTWTGAEMPAVDLSGTVSLAAAPDGTAWLATGSVTLPGDTLRTGTAIAHFDGRSWTVYDGADGLPAPDPSSSATVTAVAASSTTVIAAARDGFYRLSGDRWVRAGPRPAAAGPAWSERLVAVSADEAWNPTYDGLWHVRDGTWTRVPVAGWNSPVRAFDVARSPEGTLAVATDQGTAILRAGRWTVLGKGEAHAVTFARDGAIWVAERTSAGDAETTVASFRFDGSAWVRIALPAVTTSGWAVGLVLAPDGEPWLLSQGWDSSLDRFDGTNWVRQLALGGAGAAGVAVAPSQDLWAVFADGSTPDWEVARWDGATWWTVFPASDGLAEPGNLMGPGGFAISPDGSLWVSTDRGLVRFDDGHWSVRFAGYGFSALSFAPDGTLWAVGPSGVGRLPAGEPAAPDPAAH
jgi:ligand-binding sensor domain-containing protein